MWDHDYHRWHLLSQPFPNGWDSFLLNNVAHFALLNTDQQTRLRNDLRVLISEKNWEGCRGFEITDEVKVTIAAQACLMLLGRKHDFYSQVLSILVYPSTFVAPRGSTDEFDYGEPLAGQAVYRGPIILAWDAVLEEGRNPSLGYNVVIH